MGRVESLTAENAALKERLDEYVFLASERLTTIDNLYAENLTLRAQVTEKDALLAQSNGNFGKLLGEYAALDAQVQRVRDEVTLWLGLKGLWVPSQYWKGLNDGTALAGKKILHALDAAPEPQETKARVATMPPPTFDDGLGLSKTGSWLMAYYYGCTSEWGWHLPREQLEALVARHVCPPDRHRDAVPDEVNSE
jgi:hypothetical protein